MTAAAAGARHRRRILIVSGITLAVALPLLAVMAREPVGPHQEVIGERGAAELLRAIELPRAAQDARAAGLGESALRETLAALQGHGVSAADAGAVLVAWVRLGSAAATTPLSRIVRERLESGVRGTALAEALRASTHDPGTVIQTPPRPTFTVPADTPGERRPLSDTARLPRRPPPEAP